MVGVIGVVCEARSLSPMVRKTPRGPLHPGRCNRWHGHDGPHREIRGRDFTLLAEWSELECRPRTWMEVYNQQQAIRRVQLRDGEQSSLEQENEKGPQHQPLQLFDIAESFGAKVQTNQSETDIQ